MPSSKAFLKGLWPNTFHGRGLFTLWPIVKLEDNLLSVAYVISYLLHPQLPSTAALHIWMSHVLYLQPEGASCCGDKIQHVIAFGYDNEYNENVIITSI
jgi:hypothetical protein